MVVSATVIGSWQWAQTTSPCESCPHGAWWNAIGGPACPASHLSPHRDIATSTGKKSRPFSVST